jgi:hypothetical protein
MSTMRSLFSHMLALAPTQQRSFPFDSLTFPSFLQYPSLTSDYHQFCNCIGLSAGMIKYDSRAIDLQQLAPSSILDLSFLWNFAPKMASYTKPHFRSN